MHLLKNDQYKKADSIVTFFLSSSVFAWYFCSASKITSLLLKVHNRFAENPAPSRKFTLHPENKFLSMDFTSSEIVISPLSTGSLIILSMLFSFSLMLVASTLEATCCQTLAAGVAALPFESRYAKYRLYFRSIIFFVYCSI